jgi:hypothetical protein
MIAHLPEYAVTFVGYAARVVTKKQGRDVELAMLDFVSGTTSLRVDDGCVFVRKHAHLASFIESLPGWALKHQQLVQTGDNQEKERMSTMVTLTCGDNEIHISQHADFDKFIRQTTRRFFEVRDILKQAEKIGIGIKRRPYHEYIEGIGRTGVAQVECHGFAFLVDGNLIFHPNYTLLFIKMHNNIAEIHSLAPEFDEARARRASQDNEPPHKPSMQ